MSGKRRADLEPVSEGKKKGKRELTGEFSAALHEELLKNQVAEAWSRRTRFSHDAIVMDPDPFHHCVIPNFIQCQTFLEGLQKELLDLDFHEKCNDLYKFKQSDDLKNRDELHISALRKVLFEDFRGWLSDIAKIDLDSTIDISCAKYEYTDILLCHDDELEGRRIAFILYLVPPWDKSLGGTLDLYNTDEHFQPKQIVKSLIPSWNTLVFFEVSPVSFHQVSEVLSEGKCRLSISGWFHGPPQTRPSSYFEPLLPRSLHIPRDSEILYEWINPVYMDIDSQAQIQEEFEERSEILLKKFFKSEKYEAICEALEKEDVEWRQKGPPNKRFYEKAEEEKLPDVLKNCMELFRSEAFFLLLSNFTGLKLHFLVFSDAEDEEDEEEEEEHTKDSEEESKEISHVPSKPESYQEASGHTSQQSKTEASLQPEKKKAKNKSSDPTCTGELRYWKNGHYTLVHDTKNSEFALDLLFYCGCKGWKTEYGGFTSYIASGEDEELLTVTPEENSLALVYRDRETLKFVKYVNHQSLEQKKTGQNKTGFWDFSFVYYE
ncbi:prolyl 3-hydroxylase OGFOD1 [Antechinus flavipes]|uniref:prolyl 3-hydroxylase OGFOD1 n=1 Tax=Antechinus flavipes TaxID=38775 RepID=UPI002235DC78|nr:prolyl 3-hydroxylase OGFOD1 [Antechinus flavipes]